MDDASATAPTPSALLMSQAAQALAERNYDKAAELCQQVLAQDAHNEHAWYLSAAAAEGKNDAAKALECLDHVRKAPDLLPRATLLRSRLLFALGRLDEADQELAQAIKLAPELEPAYYLRGLLALRQQRIAEGQKLFKQALRLNPSYGPAHYELGILALQQGDLAQAKIHCAKAAQLMPEMPEAANNLGLACQAEGDMAAAEAAFRHAIELKDDYAEAWANLGLLLRTTNAEESQRCLAKALALKPELAELLPKHD